MQPEASSSSAPSAPIDPEILAILPSLIGEVGTERRHAAAIDDRSPANDQVVLRIRHASHSF